jgi:hypothetical protein
MEKEGDRAIAATLFNPLNPSRESVRLPSRSADRRHHQRGTATVSNNVTVWRQGQKCSCTPPTAKLPLTVRVEPGPDFETAHAFGYRWRPPRTSKLAQALRVASATANGGAR